MSQMWLEDVIGKRALGKLPKTDVMGTTRDDWAANATLGWDDGIRSYFLSVTGKNGNPENGLVWWFGTSFREIPEPWILADIIGACFGAEVALQEHVQRGLEREAALPATKRPPGFHLADNYLIAHEDTGTGRLPALLVARRERAALAAQVAKTETEGWAASLFRRIRGRL